MSEDERSEREPDELDRELRHHLPPDDPRRRLWDRAVTVFVPVAVALIVAFMLVAENRHVDQDLQLHAPSHARPGDRLPVRAILFDDIDRIEGPRLRSIPVDVKLARSAGPEERTLARARLRPTPLRQMEGGLLIPRDARGSYVLIARAVLPNGTQAVVHAPLRVRPDAPALRPTGRLAMPLQHYTQYAIQTTGQTPPDALEVRVTSGACVPELRCDLLVYVGEPAAAVEVERSRAVTPVARRPEDSGERTGVHAISVVTHGPEAQIDVVARRGGAEVARRPVRLPIALGSVALRADTIVDGEVVPHLRVEGASGRSGIIVDAYRDARWQQTATVPTRRAGSDGFDPPFEPLEPGVVWRIQARLDPFSSENAATRLIYVRPRGEGRERTLENVRAYARAHEIADGLLEAVAREPDLARAVAFILAPGELDLLPQPGAMSGHAQAIAGLEGGRSAVRIVAVLALIIAAIFVALIVARRGLDASAEARAVMVAAGDVSVLDERRKRRQTLTVLMISAAVLLAFLAAAAMVIARF